MSESRSLIFSCPSCCATEGVKVGNQIKCVFCGNKYRANFMDDPLFVHLCNAADERQESRFDAARRQYDKLIRENEEGPSLEEVYWGRFLCEQYVSFYQNDDNESIPSFWEINREHYAKSKSYQKAVEYGRLSGNAENYERQAELIEAYKKKYEVVKQKEPDGSQIFICFKDSGTTDRNLGYKIYNQFSGKYKIFFSPESLVDIAGNDYEPYIYHALKTAKVLLLLCSSRDMLESKWVHNEWSRFYKFSKNTDRMIVPIMRRGFDASTLPEEIKNLQGFVEDVDLIAKLSTYLSAMLQNDPEVALTSFDKTLHEIEQLSTANHDDAMAKIDMVVKENIAKPHNYVEALLLKGKIASHNYRYMKNAAAKTAWESALQVAKEREVPIKDFPEYRKYHGKIVGKRVRNTMLSLLLAILLAAGTLFTVYMIQDPMVDLYVTGRPASIEVEYGSNHVAALPTITVVTRKGNEVEVEINDSMVSGFDPTKIGPQTLTVTYDGMSIPVSINVVKYTLSAPAGLTVDGGKLVWENVPQAESYTLLINDSILIENVPSNFYEDAVFDAPGIYSVKVRANADESFGKTSGYSAIVSVIKLAHASGLAAEGTVLTWDAVANSTGYAIYVNGEQYSTAVTNTYTLPADALGDGRNEIYVVPNGIGNIKLTSEATGFEMEHSDANGVTALYRYAYVQGLTVSGNVLTWTAVPNCTKYAVYAGETKLGEATEPTYTIPASKLAIGKNEFRVLPVNAPNVTMVAGADGTDYTNGGTVRAYRYERVFGVALSGNVLTWTAVPNCTEYAVYLGNSKIAEVGEATYAVPYHKLVSGKNEFYVLPVDAPNLENTPAQNEADYTGGNTASVYKYDRVFGLSVDETTVRWSAVEQATGYAVYLNGTKIADVDSNSYEISETLLASGENKLYVIPVGAANLSSSASEGDDFTANSELTLKRLDAVTGVAVGDGQITWNAVAGATTYEIYLNGTLHGSTSNPSYAIVNTGDGTAHTDVYTVRATAEGLISSAISSESAQLYYLAAATGVAFDGTVLSWNAVDRAQGYEIYVDGTLHKHLNAETLSFNFLGELTRGEYEIKVVPVGNGTTVISAEVTDTLHYTVTETIVYVTTEQELLDVRLDMEAVYVLRNDITLTSAWTPIGNTNKPFVGRFNGGGYTISGLNVSATSGEGTGLFGVIGAAGTVVNLTLADAVCTGADYGNVALLAGINRGTVSGVTVYGSVTSETHDYVGGVVGRNYGSIYDCTNHASVVGRKNVGGISGGSDISDYGTQIYNCTNHGEITGTYRVGGVMGNVQISKKVTISGLSNTGSVTCSDEYCGGIFGNVEGSSGQIGTLSACKNEGAVTASEYVGGCFGNVGGYITVTTNNHADPAQNCTNTGTVTATDERNFGDLYPA